MSASAHQVKSLTRFVISLLILAGAFLIFQQRQYIQDSILAARYNPSPEMASIISNSKVSERGKFLLHASHTELRSRDSFNQACRAVMSEQTAVLGCYTNNRIYLFDIDDERLKGIKEVTAVHEMLHAGYERLSIGERDRVNALLEKQSLGEDEERVSLLMAEYAKSEPGEKYNELHSIIGSEIATLSPELEAYYEQYFGDRKALVSLAKQYQGVFAELQQRQEQLVNEIESIADEIDRKSAVYKRSQQILSADISSFNRRASSGQLTREMYDAERVALETRQAELQETYDAVQYLVGQYEIKRTELSAINSESNTLNRSINSSLTPVPEVR